MMNQYFNPVRSIQGNGSLSMLPELVQELGSKEARVLILGWSDEVQQMDAIQILMQKPELETRYKSFSASNPTVEQLYEVYVETKSFEPEIVIPIGGGSVLDVGKTLCLLYGEELASVEELRQLIVEKCYRNPAARWIGVPTTAGTGSEVTCWATIWDPSKEAKRSVESQNNYAVAAVIDPELAASMPVSLAVSSALDAVAHAAESYWAKASNTVSRALALEAIRLIMTHVDGLLSEDAGAHEFMARGSMLAGMAFSNTKTTACHSISYPLTMEYGIPHGTAVSMLLAPVFQVNQKNIKDPKLLLDAFGAATIEQLENRICGILSAAGIPNSLQMWKVPKNDLRRLAALGITKGRTDNNPVDLTPDMIQDILEQIYAD
ncbi:MAG: phosphonoacetaldehyde reductase [Lachnospiraceae bacterium]